MRLQRATFCLLSILILKPCFADDGTENDRRHRYGNGKNNDGAAYVGDQKTRQQLTPNMVSHYAQAAMHFATGNIAMGTMEQTKGDQLKQQIQENKKSADKNRESEKLLSEAPPIKVPSLTGANARVNTVDKERASAKSQDPGEEAAPVSQPVTPPGTSTESAPVVAAAPSVAPSAPSPISAQLATMAAKDEGDTKFAPVEATFVDDKTSPPKTDIASTSSVVATSETSKSWTQDLLAPKTADLGLPTSPTQAFADLPVISPRDRLLGAVTEKSDGKADPNKDPFASIGKDKDGRNVKSSARGASLRKSASSKSSTKISRK